ncbi:BTAD domain-containing putative transcriptional regulator [Amycolatopsis sp. PS_44_ISF1]|uniref:AfsR/SARP family transcriptional regulator n=1 Tax=Amycolatopsis sp. PS_44_ISF1 TaxID=2974917 RepID=UPI0028E04E15|nr:BTAD domain-containing putative transcriptional regulator [Amycolatopsis sp. PS_44_ISF1]MDT8910043.1 tetratricopeptide repeat protein [Amycolatopsis sp. PS_44_ISF1]
MLRLLGEVAVVSEGQRLDLGPPRQRCVLAVLALDAGRVVPIERLIDRVWGDETPRRGRETVHSYVSRLRRALADARGVDLLRRAGGYVLMAGPEIDLLMFRDLCARARADESVAVTAFTEALALWRGEALTGLTGEWAHAERDRLTQERLAAEHDLVDARLRAGHGEGLVAGLSSLAARHPLDERVAGQYLLALHQAGRTSDALQHYQRTRTTLAGELGADPGVALQSLHQRVLTGDPALAPSPALGSGVLVSSPAQRVVPRQLPAAPAHFIGRNAELDRLDAAMNTAGAPGTVIISAIAGAGGVGKTWLALHWAHSRAGRFPDGQLFVDLRGFSPEDQPIQPAAAVRGFLDALGVEVSRIPADLHAQAALYRSLVAHRRMLIVLDNAIDTAHITALLPGSASCTAVVTSRNRLPGLVTAHGAQHLPLDILDDTEARALLTARLGAPRVEAEPTAIDDLVRLCGGFPLALSIVAGRAHTAPRSSLAAIAAELREGGLDALDEGEPAASLPAVLSSSYRALPDEQALLLGLLAIAPGPDIALPAASSLAGKPRERTRMVLRGLEQASLISRDATGRYRLHDLIRRYAADVAYHDLTDETRDEALQRVVEFYLRTADAADQLLHPDRLDLRITSPEPGSQPQPLDDKPAAMAWFATEHLCLLSAQRTAADLGRDDATWQLAWVLSTFHQLRGLRHDQLATWRAALAANENQPDPTPRLLGHGYLGLTHADLGEHEEAAEHLRRAVSLAEQHNDKAALAHTHRLFARACELRGDDQRALEHSALALNLYRTLDNLEHEAAALNSVGWFAARIGNHDQAREHCLAALELYRKTDAPYGESGVLDSLGYIAHLRGRHHEAIGHYQEALALQRQLDYPYGLAETLAALGQPYVELGRYGEARQAWQEALELYRQQDRAEEAQRIQAQLEALDQDTDDSQIS